MPTVRDFQFQWDSHPIDPKCPINVTDDSDLAVAQSQFRQSAEVLFEWFEQCAPELLDEKDETLFTREAVESYVTWAVSYCMLSSSSEMAEMVLLDGFRERFEQLQQWNSLKK